MGIFHALCRSAIVVWIWSGFSALGTVYHSDGSAASVQGLHNQLLNGDTITLPAGTFTWTTGVNFTKAINVVGAGIGRTTINDNVPKNGTQASVLWRFDVAKGKSIDISGFTVHGQAQDTQGWQLGTLAIRGSSHAVRVHNIQMVSPGTLGILFTGALWGVVDHSDFRCANGKIAIYVQHNNWPGASGSFGDGSWYDSTQLGSGKGIYVEDCTFTGDGRGGSPCIDGYSGGRLVFRHNTVTNNNVGWHGTEGDRNQGTRTFEVYQNTFSSNVLMARCVQLRGGTGVVWGNTVHGTGGPTGYVDFVTVLNFRSFTSYGAPWFSPPGSVWDGNSNPNGYLLIGQIGAGKEADPVLRNGNGDPYNGTTGAPGWPHCAREPAYVWSNNWTPVPNNRGFYIGVQATPQISIGRDVINNGSTPKPGYTPYVYPHPLVTGGNPTISHT